ncbi:MAG: DUF2865 domain-containing protein [Bauldia sp.]|uniref:DUF2865 domain-containing protein n=1 Tax=Bauldia sp. TaxID=2575872 RepID=UPI001DC9B589|nr:DUF2865 domain-containing protein [Bauldia sp.]MCB1494479.1 DUF2865 domain-containing protein [Bauldia sp.]
MRYWRILALAVVATLTQSAEGSAETGACAALEARLAALDRVSDDYWDNDFRNTETAIDRKQAELDTAMRQARRAGCYGRTIFRPRGAGSNCPALTSRIERIQAELLQEQGRSHSIADDPYSVDRERSQVVGELVAKQCGDYASFERGGRRRTGLLASLFGRRGSYDGVRFYGGGYDSGFDGGTYRTVCVRTCDGYYFPISFQATAAEFGRDEAACHAQCPSTDVSLYVYRNPGETTSQMMSLAGEPYTALPTAFLYRSKYIRACSCGASPVDAYAATPVPAPVAPPAPPLIAEMHGGVLTIAPAPPPERPPPPEAPPADPPATETAGASPDGHVAPFSMKPPARPHAAAAQKAGNQGDRPVRVVGPPSYLTVE